MLGTLKKHQYSYRSYLNKAVKHHVKKVRNLADVAPYLCLNWWVHLYMKQHSVQHPYTVPPLMQSNKFVNITKADSRTSLQCLKMTKSYTLWCPALLHTDRLVSKVSYFLLHQSTCDQLPIQMPTMTSLRDLNLGCLNHWATAAHQQITNTSWTTCSICTTHETMG